MDSRFDPDSARRRPVIVLVYGQRLATGGVETHILSLVERGSTAFQWVILGSWTEVFARAASALGCRLVSWKGPRWRGDLRAVGDLARELTRVGAEIVHLHGPWWGVVVGLAARRIGCPLVRTVHLPVWSLLRGGTVARSMKLLGLRASRKWDISRRRVRWIFVAESVRTRYQELGLVTAEESVVIPNGVDTSRRLPAGVRRAMRRDLNLAEEDVAVVFVGRLDRQKGVDTLLDGLALARGTLAGVRVVLVGDGPARSALEAKTASLGLGGVVHFLGQRSDVPAILASGDLFVLPSRFEALSLSLLEALAAGLPAVVSAVGDHPRLVDSLGAGLVVPTDDAAALGAALTVMVSDAQVRAEYSKRAATLGEPFSLDTFWRHHEALYRSMGLRDL